MANIKTISNKRDRVKKELKEKREQEELNMKTNRDDIITIPPELNDEIASDEWIRITSLANEIDHLDSMDKNFLVVYCNEWSKYMAAQNEIKYNGLILQKTNKAGEIVSYENPANKVATTCISNMNSLSAKLGLALLDRLKIVAPKEEVKSNKFLELLK